MIELVHDVGVTLIEASASDEMVAMAAWVSNDADSEDRLRDRDRLKGLIKFLLKNKHMSPFEHGHFTFKIDAPIFVVREFHRHRTASYNEVSGRYTEMKPRFYAGKVARVQKGKMGNYHFEEGTPEQTAIYLQTKRASAEKEWEVYQARLEAGIAKEQSREELPFSLMTQFYVTMNPRNLMQFLTLRNDKHALKEIRDVAVKMEQIFSQKMPLTYQAYKAAAEDNDSVDVLKAEIAALKAERELLTKEVSIQGRAYGDARAALREMADQRDEAYRLRDEAVAKYNGAFTSAKESAKKSEPEETEVDRLIAESLSYIAPKIGKAAESAAPIYNVYVQASKNIDRELIDSVISSMKKFNEGKRK